MLVRDVMTSDVETIHPDQTIMEAAQKMKGRNVGPLPVMENNQIIGMLTDRDIAIRVVAEKKDANATKVRDILFGREVICCFDDQEIHEAAKLMEDNEVRRLPVLNRDKNLVGILSLSDLAEKSQDEDLCCEVLEKVSEPAMV